MKIRQKFEKKYHLETCGSDSEVPQRGQFYCSAKSKSFLQQNFDGPVSSLYICLVFMVLIQIRLVENTKTGKPRGYAFIEFEKERDMHSK